MSVIIMTVDEMKSEKAIVHPMFDVVVCSSLRIYLIKQSQAHILALKLAFLNHRSHIRGT